METQSTVIEIAVSDLPIRYSIGKQAIYNRLEHLGIKSHKRGRNAYIWSNELEYMDDLHAHIQAGGFLSGYAGIEGEDGLRYAPGVHSPSQEVHGQTNIVPIQKSAIAKSSGTISPAVPLAITLQHPPDPLAPHRQLKEVAEQGWQITTSQLKAIIGKAPVSLSFYGTFKLVRIGRIGRECGWYVFANQCEPCV